MIKSKTIEKFQVDYVFKMWVSNMLFYLFIINFFIIIFFPSLALIINSIILLYNIYEYIDSYRKGGFEGGGYLHYSAFTTYIQFLFIIEIYLFYRVSNIKKIESTNSD
jgi:hypothetical protein